MFTVTVQPPPEPSPVTTSETSSSFEQTFQGVSEKQEKRKGFALPDSAKISSPSSEMLTDYSGQLSKLVGTLKKKLCLEETRGVGASYE